MYININMGAGKETGRAFLSRFNQKFLFDSKQDLCGIRMCCFFPRKFLMLG